MSNDDNQHIAPRALSKTLACKLQLWVDRARAERDAQQQATRDPAAAQQQQAQRAAHLLAAAQCPARHIAHLGRIDPATSAWSEVFRTLDARTHEAEGYLCAMLGGRGGGKTQCAVCLIDAACRRGQTCRYVKALDLFRTIRRAFGPEPTISEDRLIDSLARLDLLVIDEAHQRGQTAFEDNTLVNLLDRRYDAMKSTILLANQTRQEFAANVGDSIVSRLHETGAVFEFTWASYRTPGQWTNSAEE
jgi:DNA replication protein DnaC